jgi:UDP:flavonoid glycosyltransferase YjiC (YdhE family)
MSALARQLQSRNHDVVAVSLPVSEPFARAANLPFVPFGEKEFSAEKFAETVRKNSRLKGEESQQFVLDAIAAIAEVKWRILPRLPVSLGIDAVLDVGALRFQPHDAMSALARKPRVRLRLRAAVAKLRLRRLSVLRANGSTTGYTVAELRSVASSASSCKS